jgi:hypothetical protein
MWTSSVSTEKAFDALGLLADYHLWARPRKGIEPLSMETHALCSTKYAN